MNAASGMSILATGASGFIELNLLDRLPASVGPVQASLWSGRASVTFHAPELAWLAHAEVLGARTNQVAWVKPYGTIVHRDIRRAE